MPWLPALFAYPLYQMWLIVWTGRPGGGVFGHVLLAFPVGVATELAVEFVLSRVERKAAVDEEG